MQKGPCIGRMEGRSVWTSDVCLTGGIEMSPEDTTPGMLVWRGPMRARRGIRRGVLAASKGRVCNKKSYQIRKVQATASRISTRPTTHSHHTLLTFPLFAPRSPLPVARRPLPAASKVYDI